MYCPTQVKISFQDFDLRSNSNFENVLLLADQDAKTSYRMALYALTVKKMQANDISMGAN